MPHAEKQHLATTAALDFVISAYTLLTVMWSSNDAERIRARCLAVASSCTAASLRRASRAIGRIYDEIMEPSGLRGTQFSLLVGLNLTGGAPVARLADELGLDRTTMTRNLGPLERDGLVTSAPGPDRRVRLVRLTPLGRRALASALPLWEEAQRRVVAELGQTRWEGLSEALRAANVVRGETPHEARDE